MWYDQCASRSADKWARVQAYIESSSFPCFVPDDRPIPVSEYFTDVSCKKLDFDAQDVVVTMSPSTTRTLVVISILTPISSSEISFFCNIFPGLSMVSEPSRKHHWEDKSSVSSC